MINTIKISEIKWIIIVTLSLTFVIYILSYYFNINIEIDYRAYLGIIASLIGFLFTAISIIIVFPEKGKITKLEKHKLYPVLLKIFLLTLFSLMILLCLLIFGDLFGEYFYFQKMLFIFLLILSLFLIFCDLWIFKRMIDLLV